MSNNSFATRQGREIGRAQALQAEACGLEPMTDFNPVLLKPSGPRHAQVVVHGVVSGNIASREWRQLRRRYMPVVREAFERLAASYDLVILEGAGSPAEINLRHQDIVNMEMAKAAAAPVVVVGDIERGGVFASLVGTHALLDSEDRRHIRGFIINKFQGEQSLLKPAITRVEDLLQVRCLGVLPMWNRLRLPEEDSVGWPTVFRRSLAGPAQLTIGIADLPYLSNSTDVESLAALPGVRMIRVSRPVHEGLDLFILPGTKHTVNALNYVRQNALDLVARTVWKTGGVVLGICGGYQLLGRQILDPDRIESSEAEVEGLGLLDISTAFGREKTTVQVEGRHLASGTPIRGYEIHMGEAIAGPSRRPFLEVRSLGHTKTRLEGAVSPDGRVIGTSVHGLFESDGFRNYFLTQICAMRSVPANAEQDDDRSPSDVLDQWADYMGSYIDMPSVEAIIESGI